VQNPGSVISGSVGSVVSGSVGNDPVPVPQSNNESAETVVPAEQKKCTGGCDFFGSSVTFGYCSVCWKKLSPAEQEILKKPKIPPPAPKPIPAIVAPYSFDIYHYNGLPPSGPFLAHMTIFKTDEIEDTAKRIDVLNNIAMVVHRKWYGSETDGHWLYEVALRIDEKKQIEEVEPPTSQWRCSHCVVNHIFTYNPPGTVLCTTCQQHISKVETKWVTYDQLGALTKREVDTTYSPKIRSLIHTRWPQTTIIYHSKTPPTI